MKKTRYIPTDYTEIHKTDHTVVYGKKWEDGARRAYSAMGFIGKQSSPAFHYGFLSEADALSHITDWAKKVETNKKVRADARAESRKPHSLKVGDILYTSWGYDQTNIDFYEVTRVIGEHTVEIRQNRCTLTQSEYAYEDIITPIRGKYVEPRWEGDKDAVPMIKRVSHDNLISITSYATAYPWDGKPKHQTALGYGH